MDGVRSVKLDVANKLATCTVVAEVFDEDKALAALDVDFGKSSVASKK